MTPRTPLDFAEIRRNCPKAFAAFLSHWAGIPNFGEMILSYSDFRQDKYIEQATKHPRDLYDFFDANGVYVAIRPHRVAKQWMYEIECEFEGILETALVDWDHPTRAAAEAAAFGAAFDKVEGLLNQKEG